MSDPVAITRDAANALGISALDMRQGLTGLSAPSTGNTFGGISGVFPGGTSGGGLSNDCQVFASSGMTVTVNGGHYAADRGSLGAYLGMITGAVAVTHGSANVSNPRIDYVVIRTRDPGVDTGTTQSAYIQVLPGSPAAVPTEPSNQMTSGDVLLAAVTIRANTSSVLSSDISDRRKFIAARGGIQPTNPLNASSAGSYEGDYRDNTATNALERWNGSAWEVVASPAAWVRFTPQLFSDGAGAVNLGSGGVAQGAYQQIGKTLRVRYYFQAVRPCNLGYGNIYTKLPNNLYSAVSPGDHHGRCQLNTQPPGGAYLSWIGDAGVFSNSNLVYPSFNKTVTDNTFAPYRVAASQGAIGTGIPFLTNEYPDPLRGLGISVELEVQ